MKSLDKIDPRYIELVKKISAPLDKFFYINWPALLVGQMWVESRGKPMAFNRVPARGLMQITEPLARDFKVKNFDLLFDPELNISIAVKFWERNLRQISKWSGAKDDNLIPYLKHAIAAYNCGSGYIRAAIKAAQKNNIDPSNWQLLLKNPDWFTIWSLRKMRRIGPKFSEMRPYVEDVWTEFTENIVVS